METINGRFKKEITRKGDNVEKSKHGKS